MLKDIELKVLILFNGKDIMDNLRAPKLFKIMGEPILFLLTIDQGFGSVTF